jgi:hypothetical protein
VAGDADLSGENYVFANARGAGEPDLGAEEGVLPYGGAVADLDEVVDLCAEPDAGFPDGSAVDGGIGLDLDVVFKDGGAGLQNLVPGAVACCGSGVAGEAEAVGTDDDAVLEGDVVAETAALSDDGVGVGEEVRADCCAGVDDDVRQQGGVWADLDVVPYDDVGAYVGVGADGRGWGDDGGGMDSRRVGGGWVEQLECAGEGEVGVRDAEARVVRARGV